MDPSESLAWPAASPGWAGRVALMSLVTLIPVLGQMALYGWMLAALESARAGRAELPPAGLRHIPRGARLFAVLLLYGVLYSLLVGGLVAVASLLLGAAGRGASPLVAAAGFALLAVAVAAGLAGFLAITMSHPQIILATEAGGIRGGLDVRRIARMARAKPQAWILCGLMTVAAQLVGAAGLLACGVGVFLTIAYAYAMIAAVTHSFEAA